MQAKQVCEAKAPDQLNYVDFFTLLQNLKSELGENYDKVVAKSYGSLDDQKSMYGKLRSAGEGFACGDLPAIVPALSPADEMPISYCAGSGVPMASTVDHLFAGGRLVPEKLHIMADTEVVRKGIPNELFGSDHIPLVADLKWASGGNGYPQ